MLTKTGYQTIKNIVMDRIRDNTWPPGTLLPGEIELAEEFQCARATVNRAMRELAEEGIIDRKRKSGTRVKAAPTRNAKFAISVIREEIESTGAAYRYSLLNRKTQKAPDWLRGRLGLLEDADVLHLQCMHYANGRPFQYENRWINLATVPAAGQESFQTLGPNEWLLNQVPFSDVELTFAATNASDAIASVLNVSSGEAVFTAERTTWLANEPVTFAQMYFHPGYRLTTRI